MEKNDSFKIMKNTKELVSDVVEFSRNFPKSESVLKKNLQDELFNLVRLLNSYIVNRDPDSIFFKYPIILEVFVSVESCLISIIY